MTELEAQNTDVSERKRKTRKQWAALIKQDLERSVKAVIATGRHLLEAKEDIPHGEWTEFLATDLNLSERTAQRFMEIARHPVLSDPTHVSALPPSWGTLYELSRIEPPKLEQAIEHGAVTPELERKKATELVKAYAEPTDEPERPRRSRSSSTTAVTSASPLKVIRELMAMSPQSVGRFIHRSVDDPAGLIDELQDWLLDCRNACDALINEAFDQEAEEEAQDTP